MFVLRKKIAILSSCSIFSRGLQHILDEFFNQADTYTFHSIEELMNHGADNYELFFLSTENLVSQYEYFLPRKNRTIICTDAQNYKAPFHVLQLNCTLSDTIDNLQSIFSKIEKPNKNNLREELSTREKDVLRLIVKGLINKDIADKLCISLNTVLTHRKNITSKLGIKSVSGLTFYAMMNGLISENE